jgi:hypothetical protein
VHWDAQQLTPVHHELKRVYCDVRAAWLIPGIKKAIALSLKVLEKKYARSVAYPAGCRRRWKRSSGNVCKS